MCHCVHGDGNLDPRKSTYIINRLVDLTAAFAARGSGRVNRICSFLGQGYSRHGCLACWWTVAEQRHAMAHWRGARFSRTADPSPTKEGISRKPMTITAAKR